MASNRGKIQRGGKGQLTGVKSSNKMLKWYMGFFKAVFKIKSRPKKEGLEKAKEMKLITEGEFFRLKSQRAENDYEDFLAKNKIKPKVRRRRTTRR